MTITEANRKLDSLTARMARNGLDIINNNISSENSSRKDIVELLRTRDELTAEAIGLHCAVEKAILPISDIIVSIVYYRQLILLLQDVKKHFYSSSLQYDVRAQLSTDDIEDIIIQTEEKITSLQAMIDSFEAENEVEGLVSQEASQN